MSTTETKMSYTEALGRAQVLELALAPFCERTLIAGSIRRQKAEIGDIELVVIAKTEPILDLFGDMIGARSLLEEALGKMNIHCTKNGARMKQFEWDGAPVDLFIPTCETWGCVATIRTGSADFTHWLVTPRSKGGGCFAHLRFQDGRLMDGQQALKTNEELELFDALDLKWIDPVERIEGRWRR